MLSSLASGFDSYFDDVLNILYGSKSTELELAKSHFIKSARYNVPNGKKLRGRLCVATFRRFVRKEPSNDILKSVNLVGWSIELMQAGFLVHDDLIDGSTMRRGQTAWGLLQKIEGHGLIGINDGLHLYISVQQLIVAALNRSPLRNKCFQILELFGDCANATCFGQALDMLGNVQVGLCSGNDGNADKDRSPQYFPKLTSNRLGGMTVDRFATIAKWKTSHYSFVLPVIAGMLLADVKSEVLLSNAKSVLFKIGEYFQAQDDYLDVYGDEQVTGKVGTDIAEGKCSWLIATALEKASDEQRAILNRNYGIRDTSCVSAVIKVFDELDLPSIYSNYESRAYADILGLIDEVSSEGELVDLSDPNATKLPKDFLVEVAHLFYRRKK
uniref:Farnesyl pyrophosphate synthase n=2 Tax=Mesocestoides corti TaxID=53468 RepID=A0A5K3FRC2_MESCO